MVVVGEGMFEVFKACFSSVILHYTSPIHCLRLNLFTFQNGEIDYQMLLQHWRQQLHGITCKLQKSYGAKQNVLSII